MSSVDVVTGTGSKFDQVTYDKLFTQVEELTKWVILLKCNAGMQKKTYEEASMIVAVDGGGGPPPFP